jgi:hypothetical protein
VAFRGLRVAAACALVAALTVPAGGVATAAEAPAGERVYVFGDSVVVSGEAQIAVELALAGWDPEIVAYPGTDVGHVAARALTIPDLGDVVVLAVGYTYFWKPAVLRRQIDAALAALTARGVRRVVWLNIPETRAQRRDFNDALRAAARRWPVVDVADWAGYSRGRTDAFEPDGYHLLPAGGTLMGTLVVEHLARHRAGAPRSLGPDYGPRPPVRPVLMRHGAAAPVRPASTHVTPPSRAPYVGLAAARDGGSWLARRDGTVEARDGATDHGSVAPAARTAPIVGIAATPTGDGYWLAAADGSVHAFGDAPFEGSARAVRPRAAVVGIAPTPTGAGYWLADADGRVLGFGDARYLGAPTDVPRAEPIVGIAATPRRQGYVLVGYDGGVFAFGAARYRGSSAEGCRYWKAQAIATSPDGRGYWVLDASGGVTAFGAPAFPQRLGHWSELFVALAAPRRGGVVTLGQALA